MRRLVHRRAVHTEASELVDDPLRRPAHVRGPFGIGADTRDREELVELGEMIILVLAQVVDGRIGHAGAIGLARHAPMIGWIGRCNRRRRSRVSGP
jgi:hypothetical protein